MMIQKKPARLIPLFVMLAVVIYSTGCKPKAQESSPAAAPSQQDIDAINRLRQQDAEASKKWDVEALVALWTDDIVALLPDREPLIGKEANRNFLLSAKQQSEGVEVVEYKFDFKELTVAGDWAYEWGTLSVAEKLPEDSEPFRSKINLMRVLKRSADGSWKVSRTIFNNGDIGEPPQ
jgi:ketosteroid isomerase-like protein